MSVSFVKISIILYSIAETAHFLPGISTVWRLSDMKQPFHGVFSLLLFILAVAGALITLWRQSPWLGLLYLAITGLSAYGILFAYCCKCGVRFDNCSHVFPGRLTLLLPQRKQGPYSFGDIIATGLFLVVILVFPQYWLLKHAATLILFWVLVIAAVAEILIFVCSRCENKQCLMCPNKQIGDP